jgi:hypothetical protein
MFSGFLPWGRLPWVGPRYASDYSLLMFQKYAFWGSISIFSAPEKAWIEFLSRSSGHQSHRIGNRLSFPIIGHEQVNNACRSPTPAAQRQKYHSHRGHRAGGPSRVGQHDARQKTVLAAHYSQKITAAHSQRCTAAAVSLGNVLKHNLA